MSDLWRAYGTVNNLGYRHLTVNHRLNFVDPVTHATTNHVESMWCKAKQRNKKMWHTPVYTDDLFNRVYVENEVW